MTRFLEVSSTTEFFISVLLGIALGSLAWWIFARQFSKRQMKKR
ncbi:MAG TPA: hypothetical protein ACFYD6_11005 [Candidatus Brocadiia bacterium]|nr:hypothetical protein [Candidatus Brocadiales bacterium]